MRADLASPLRSTIPRPRSRRARTGATSLEKSRTMESVTIAMRAVSKRRQDW